ncbi:VWA domain-containing protein [Alkaliflexus imshenetskii]|uniref:VWA domain-containing protein n=1 Tax=Alkaliflexus imshenetskii TaxID=286730 RepID=UPI00047A67A6|nr:VWA domain-containing protein [Alkaliflexus imshenetskii]
MFRFGNPEYLYLLLLIPALAFLNLLFTLQKRKALKRFGNPELVSHLMPDVSIFRPVAKFYLLLLALMSIIFMLAAPQFGTRLQTVQRSGIEVIVALDVSNSMNARDIEPSRLERAKQAIIRLTDRLVNDRIGLIVFAGQAYTQLPITSDYASAKMFVSNITTDIVPTQGTAIGAAINLAINSFTELEEVNRAIIVITDGENHEDDAVGAARKAAEKGIKVYTVGMGSPDGGPIPLSGTGNFLRDRDGNVVITKLDEQMLAQIAAAGNGEYIPANNIRAGINKLMNELSDLEKADFETKVYTDFEDQFQYLALLALFILIIDFMILERKNRLLKNIDLFTVEEKKEA